MTFAWNNDDVNKVMASMFAPPGDNYKFIDLPLSNYASSSFDSIVSGGKVVGASMFSGYSFNERKMLSLGFVEEQYAKVGTKLTLVWGEEGGGTRKTTVERHKQTELRVEVGPTPYGQQARETYHQDGVLQLPRADQSALSMSARRAPVRGTACPRRTASRAHSGQLKPRHQTRSNADACHRAHALRGAQDIDDAVRPDIAQAGRRP